MLCQSHEGAQMKKKVIYASLFISLARSLNSAELGAIGQIQRKRYIAKLFSLRDNLQNDKPTTNANCTHVNGGPRSFVTALLLLFHHLGKFGRFGKIFDEQRLELAIYESRGVSSKGAPISKTRHAHLLVLQLNRFPPETELWRRCWEIRYRRAFSRRRGADLRDRDAGPPENTSKCLRPFS